MAAAERAHRFQNLWFVTPALRGHYPEGVLPQGQQEELLGWRGGDEKIMRARLDFIGLNYYSSTLVSDAPRGNGVPGLNTEAQWARAPGSNRRTDTAPHQRVDVVIESVGHVPASIAFADLRRKAEQLGWPVGHRGQQQQ